MQQAPETAKEPTKTGGAVAAFLTPHTGQMDNDNRTSMDDSVQKSCWGLTAKAVIGFAGIMLLVLLFGGGSETAAVLAAG